MKITKDFKVGDKVVVVSKDDLDGVYGVISEARSLNNFIVVVNGIGRSQNLSGQELILKDEYEEYCKSFERRDHIKVKDSTEKMEKQNAELRRKVWRMKKQLRNMEKGIIWRNEVIDEFVEEFV